MTELVQRHVRPDSPVPISVPSSTDSNDSRLITEAAARVAGAIYDRSFTIQEGRVGRSIDEQLFDSLAACKITASQFSMLFDQGWQVRFFAQLDQLMDSEGWDADEVPVTTGSFATLMRLLMKLRDKKRPGLGLANQGNIIATWSAGTHNRLSIECLPNDRLWWIVSYTLDGEQESAAGNTSMDRILHVLQPYDPGHWFDERAEHPA